MMKLLVALAGLTVAVADFVSYPRQPIYQKSSLFSLKVNGTYTYTVDYQPYDYVHLSMDEGHDTEFRIKLNSGEAITSYNISPKKLAIHATTDKNELIFKVNKAHYLIVKLNSQKEFVVLADPSETNAPKASGKGIYNVKDYKADASGKSLTTNAFSSALKDAGAHPGSTVYVPPGLYSVGNIVIPSATSLYIAGGAVLHFTGNGTDYKKYFHKESLNLDGTWWLTTAVGSKDVKVFGRGILDGNGYNTRKNKYVAHILAPAGTSNFHCDGILIRDSPFWTVTANQVSGGLLENMKVLNRFDLTENDAFDINESSDVTVRRSLGISNDDSFSTKTWAADTDIAASYPYSPRPLKNALFDDCLAWTHCYGYKIGEGVWQAQDGVTFQNSVVYYAGIGIGIHHKWGSQTSSHTSFRSMDLESIHGTPGGEGAWIDFYVDDAGQGVGVVDHVYVKNVIVRSLGDKRAIIRGVPGANVSVVTLEDVYMLGSKTPATTLKEMNILDTSYSDGIRIANSK